MNICIAEIKMLSPFLSNRSLASSGKNIKDPFLLALAQREEANRSGKMTVRYFWKGKLYFLVNSKFIFRKCSRQSQSIFSRSNFFISIYLKKKSSPF